MEHRPRRPAQLDPLAEQILSELARHAASSEIVLGGYLALSHYVDYRRTHDIDAWWRGRATPEAEVAIRSAMLTVATTAGLELKERRFGETISFELHRRSRKQFSFQIAVRSVELEPPQASAWPPIGLEALTDNIGAKMNALVDRGSPRDFTDIYHVVRRGLVTVEQCWRLWSRKNPGADVAVARGKVIHHLAALEGRRPLESIARADERARAEEARTWFHREFLRKS